MTGSWRRLEKVSLPLIEQDDVSKKSLVCWRQGKMERTVGGRGRLVVIWPERR